MHSLPPNASAQRLALTNYTVKDGLVGQSVKSIWQDSTGFIWISTMTGFSIYDGSKFTNFTTLNGLPHPMVNQVVCWRASGTWIVTNTDSTNLFSNGRITTFPYKGQCPIINHVLETTPGRFLLGTDAGLFEYAGEAFRHIQMEGVDSSETISRIKALNDSTFVLCKQDAGKMQIIRRSQTSYRLVASYPRLFLLSEVRDHTGRLWVAPDKGGLRIFTFDPRHPDNIRSQLPPPSLAVLEHTPIHCLLEDETHTIWMGTVSGLLRWQEGGAVERYTIGIDIGTNNITCLYQDREKNIWIGTQNGLCKLVKPVVTYYDSEEKLGETFFASIWSDPNRNLVYLPHPSALTTIDGNGGVSNFSFAKDRTHGTQAVLPDKNGLWVLLNDYGHPASQLVRSAPLQYKTGTPQIQFRLQMPNSSMYKMDTDRYGNPFLCGVGGLRAVYGKTLCWFPEIEGYFDAIAFDHRNRLWVGTFIGGGIYEYEVIYLPHTIRLRLLRHFEGELFSRSRSAMCDKEGNVWFGTRLKGLLRFGLDSSGVVTGISHWSMREGLSDDWVTSLFCDRHEDIWVGTAASIDFLVHDHGQYTIRNYGKEININGAISGIAQTPDGDFWLAENNVGVTRFTLTNRSDSVPPVVITRILASGRSDSIVPIATPSLRLPHNENNLDFDYTAMTFKNEKLITYSYWLEGATTDWSPASSSHSIHLVSLPPGPYTLRVRARLANGMVSNKMAVFHFEIMHAFWDTWWFRTLIAGAILLVLYAAYRYRIAQLSRIQAVRNNLSKDLHDDIGSTLSSINILSTIASGKMQEGRPEESISILARINRYTAEISEKMSDIVWAINPENETVENLVHRLRRAAGETCSASNIALDFAVDQDLAYRKLRMELRKNIFLIAKEAVNNSIKHAGCSRISVQFRSTPNGLQLNLEDNGSGFDMNTCIKGNGLKNMASRAREIDAELDIRSVGGLTRLTLLAAVP